MKLRGIHKVILLLTCIIGFAAFLGFLLTQKIIVIPQDKLKIVQDFFAKKFAPQVIISREEAIAPEEVPEETRELIITAKIATLNGEVQVRSPLRKEWASLQQDMVLNEGDIVKTNKASSLVCALTGDGFESSILVQENSQVMFLKLLSKKGEERLILLDLAEGRLIVTTSKINTEDTRFEIKTPTSIANIKKGSILVTVAAKT